MAKSYCILIRKACGFIVGKIEDPFLVILLKCEVRLVRGRARNSPIVTKELKRSCEGAALLLRKLGNLCLRAWFSVPGWGSAAWCWVTGVGCVSCWILTLPPPPTQQPHCLPESCNGGVAVRVHGAPNESGDIFTLVESVSGGLSLRSGTRDGGWVEVVYCPASNNNFPTLPTPPHSPLPY